MSAPERTRPSLGYLELDSDTIHATTPVEFRQLLDHIRVRAGLTPSQIAIKTTIPRSQAYNMVAVTRTTLPSKPEQVREFVEACGLAPVQVGLVMNLWSNLDQQAREEQEAGRGPSRGGPAAPDTEFTQSFFFNEAAASFTGSEGQGSKQRRKRPTTDRRPPKATSDLLFLVLDSEERTQRALRLLLPIVAAFVAIVAAFVVWAILQPGRASMIGAILGGGVVLPVTTGLRRLVRR
jgi:hypothetical protein